MENEFSSSSIQKFFNEVRGVVCELNDGEKYCSITIRVGHDHKTLVNCACKKSHYEKLTENIELGDKVSIRFYPVSNFKNSRWYSSHNILDVNKI